MHYLLGSRQTFAEGGQEVSESQLGLPGDGDDDEGRVGSSEKQPGSPCVDHMSGERGACAVSELWQAMEV